MTPRALALAKAAEIAADTASRSHDTRHHLEALRIKRALDAELERVAASRPTMQPRAGGKAWRW